MLTRAFRCIQEHLGATLFTYALDFIMYMDHFLVFCIHQIEDSYQIYSQLITLHIMLFTLVYLNCCKSDRNTTKPEEERDYALIKEQFSINCWMWVINWITRLQQARCRNLGQTPSSYLSIFSKKTFKKWLTCHRFDNDMGIVNKSIKKS